MSEPTPSTGQPDPPTHTGRLVGDSLDAIPAWFVDLRAAAARRLVLDTLTAAEARGESAAARELMAELGIFDLAVPPPPDGLFLRAPDPGAYAAHSGFTRDTPGYVVRRLTETQHPVLRIRYLEYLLSQTPKGHDWARIRRELGDAYRAYVEHARAHLAAGADLGGGEIERAVVRAADLIGQPGVVNSAKAVWRRTIARRSPVSSP